MPRRVSLPGAAELFRTTHTAESTPSLPEPNSTTIREPSNGSGRVRHDEKITVYVSKDELLQLEQARLTLRAHYGQAVDRGRIVRAALAWAMSDLTENGESSELVRRLSKP